MVFQVNAKHFFLTYPQANNIQNKEELLEFLTNVRDCPDYICIGQERHQDGNYHFHALVSYARRFNCRNDRFFDFKGNHPNIQSAKNVGKVRSYVIKDGDFIESGQQGRPSLHDKCYDMDIAEWEEYCVSNNIPWGFCQSIWKRCHPPKSSFTIDEGCEHGNIGPALEQFHYDQWERPLVLLGPTGCGKTSWAIKNAPKPALLISHLDRLSELNESHKSIIFDDMVFKHMPTQAQIHLVDYHCPRDIHCRYRVASIPKGMPKIFTCNERPFEQHPAIERRIRVYSINTFP